MAGYADCKEQSRCIAVIRPPRRRSGVSALGLWNRALATYMLIQFGRGDVEAVDRNPRQAKGRSGVSGFAPGQAAPTDAK